MKKVICLILAVLLCASMAVPAFAADTPSPYPFAPTLVPFVDGVGKEAWGTIREGDNVVDYIDHGCLRITPIADVYDDTKEVPQVIEDLLLFVESGLKDESIVLPYEKFNAGLKKDSMEVRDIYDIRWACEEHKGALDEESVVIDLTFDMGFTADEEVYVLCYDEANDDWAPIVKTVNNGDGTITCTFEHFCAFTFSVSTAPASNSNSMIWMIGLAVVVIGAAVVLVMKNKKKEEVAA